MGMAFSRRAAFCCSAGERTAPAWAATPRGRVRWLAFLMSMAAVVTSGVLASPVAAVRPAPPGSLDSTFGVNGIVQSRPAPDLAKNVALDAHFQSTGKLVVAGCAETDTRFRHGCWGGGTGDIVLTRYLPSGELDSSFGTSGVVRTDFERRAAATDMTVGPNDEIFVTGRASSCPVLLGYCMQSGFVARYNADGALDQEFGPIGSGGRVVLNPRDFGRSTLNPGADVAVQPDGAVVVVDYAPAETGLTDYPQWFEAYAIRLTAEGEVDRSFGKDGLAATRYGTQARESYATSVAIDAQGRIVISGGADRLLGVARFTPDGKPDATFGSGTGAYTAEALVEGATALGFQDVLGQQYVLVAANNGSTYREADTLSIRRLDPSGLLDQRFGSSGVVETASRWSVADLVVDPADNTVVVAAEGLSSGYSYVTDFTLYRYTADGRVFPRNPEITTDFEQLYEFASTVLIQPDHKIVAVGTVGDGSTSAITIARYMP